MSDVPDEILREILSRLPVAPLLRFRCVSKSWKSLIDNQQFIKHHLNHSRKTNSNLNIVLEGCRRHLYSADFDLLNETNMAAFKELSHPLIEATYGRTRISGSCDGLLVLRNDKADVTILWNPSVRRSHEIPFCGFEYPGYIRNISYGFGYNVVSDDYKLIRVAQWYDNKSESDYNSEVRVYSLKSDSWRRIPDVLDYIEIETSGVLANGALHWKLDTDTNHLVTAIDLGTEEFRLVPLPKFAGDVDIITELGGCLSLVCYHSNDGLVDIWIMKEYGVQESWSILFTYDNRYFDFQRPLAYSKCGRKVLLGRDYDCDALMWYDLDKKSTDVPMVQMPLESPYDTCTCLQSLVLLNNGPCDFVFVTKKKQKRKDKKRSRRTR